MNALQMLLEQFSMLRSIRQPDDSGCVFLRGKIEEVAARSDLTIPAGELSSGFPETIGGYRSAAVVIFGETSRAVVYLDQLVSQNGVDAKFATGELDVSYKLGLHESNYEVTLI